MTSRTTPTTREGLRRWLRYFAVGLASRIVVVVLGCAFADPSDRPVKQVASRDAMAMHHRAAMMARSSRWVEPWYRWDAIWYAEISENGYSYHPGLQNSVAFLPLLPLKMASGAAMGLDRYWVGLVVPNLAFAAGLAWFALAVIRLTGDPATARRSCFLLVAYPWSFFFSAPYQESLGFCLSACGLWAWLCDRPGVSATASGLASTSRISSVAFGFAIVAEWVWNVARGNRPRRWSWPVAMASFLGLAAYYAYLQLQFGEPLAQMKTQAAWGRKPASLYNFAFVAWYAILMLWASPSRTMLLGSLLVMIGHRPILRGIARVSGPLARAVARAAPTVLIIGVSVVVVLAFRNKRLLTRNDLFNPFANVVVTTCFLALGLRAWVRRGPFWACLIIMPIAMAMATGSLLSMTRLALASYPVMIEAAEVFKDRLSFWTIAGLMASLQVVVIGNYVHWYFCG